MQMKRSFLLLSGVVLFANVQAAPVKIDAEKVPVGVMYAPFCRTEYVNTNVWEQDIRTMSELGYNCLHGFSEWFRVEREPGVYDFSEVDLLVSLCHKYGITPIINVCTANGFGYYPPRWLQREYKGEGMVDCDGAGIPVRSQYVSPCLDDPEYLRYAERYLAALGRHFAGDSRVGGWVIWGEPALNRNGKPICYCKHTRARFRAWLKEKYKTIGELNRVWGWEGPSEWKSFDEVLPPVGPSGHEGSYESWEDFNDFMTSNFARHIRRANDIMKQNGSCQPTINELFCWVQTGGLCNDQWALAESSDIVGMSQYQRPGLAVELAATVADSIARRVGKSVFVVEAHGGPRVFAWGDVRTPGVDELRAEAVQTAGLGTKGVMYWCYRPRLSDREGGVFGLCRADGKPLPRAVETARLAKDFAALGRRLADADRRPEVAVLYQAGVHYARAEGCAAMRSEAIEGAARVCFDAHVTPRYVNEAMIAHGLPADVKVLLLPFAYAIDEPTAKGIREFVRKGGTVVADFSVAFKTRNGHVYFEGPGAGLREVFGVEREEPFVFDHKSLLPEDNVYGIGVSSLEAPSMMDVLTPTTAKTLASHRGKPLVAMNAFGEGRACYLAWTAFADYSRNGGGAALRKLLQPIFREAGVKPFVSLGKADELATPGVSTSVLYRPGARILTFVNGSYDPKKLEARIPAATRIEKLYGEGVAFTQERSGDDIIIRADLAAWQSLMVEVGGGCSAF